MVWPKLRLLSSQTHARWSIRSMLLLTSISGYLLCLGLYNQSAWVTGVRLALSVFLIGGLGQQLRSSTRLVSESEGASASKRTIPLLLLLSAILVSGILTTVTEWLIWNQKMPFADAEHKGIWYRGWSTVWTLSLFLSSLTAPWMTDEKRWTSKQPIRFAWSLGASILSCICLLAMSAIFNGFLPALVMIACNNMLMSWSFPASASAGIVEDRDIRLQGMESTALWLIGLWGIAVVGCLCFLASLATHIPTNKGYRWTRGMSLLCLGVGLVANAWIMGWWIHRVSPPFGETYKELPAILLLAPIVSALVIAMYFVTRFQPQSDSKNLALMWDGNGFAPLPLHAADSPSQPSAQSNLMSDSIWVGVLFMAMSFPAYRAIVSALIAFQSNPDYLISAVAEIIANEDSRLDVLLAAYGLQWMIRKIRRGGRTSQRWPSLDLAKRSDVLIAWLFVINLLVCSVPFGIAFWFL